MAFINHPEKAIEMKVVYCGPAGSGKTATLQHIYLRTRDPSQGALRPETTHDGRQYDFLPFSLGEIGGYRTTLNLYTTPSAAAAAEERRHLMQRVDGVVFVADCRAGREAANLACLQELHGNVQSHGFDLARLPFVLQLNHSDAPGAASPAAVATPLAAWHPHPQSVPVHISAAPSGQGVFETLKSVSRLCLMELKKNA